MRLPAALLALALLAPRAHACEMMAYEHVRVSPRVHVFQAAEGTTGIVNGNIVAVVGRDAILLVDTGQILSNARRILADLRAISRAPVRYIVNTHWHGDHVLANSVFKEAFPEAQILAHSFTIAEGAKRYADYAARTRQTLPAVVDQARKRREDTTSEDEKLWITRTLDCVDKFLPQVDETRYVGAQVVVDTEMAVDLGGVVALVRHIGTGNTAGDLVVWVPDEKVVATGDMVVAPVPYAIGSNGLEAWARTLGAVRKLGATTIVPGHGPVMRDDGYLRDLEELLLATRAQLTELHARGVSRAEAVDKLDVPRFRSRYVTTPMRRQAFEQFFVKAAINEVWPKPEAKPAEPK